MTKSITFSRYYPGYHSKAGQPTHFIEMLMNWYWETSETNPYHNVPEMFIDLNGEKFSEESLVQFADKLERDAKAYKNHTIRKGSRWKAGNKFSPRVWSGRPYSSKQITILPDIKIERVFDFEIQDTETGILWIDGKVCTRDRLATLASNDGLTVEDLLEWFRYPRPFKGQIICWNKNINY